MSLLDAVLHTVRNAHTKATGTWTGASWRHVLNYGDGAKYGESPTYCEGDAPGTCRVCANAQTCAERAEDWAATALAHAEANEWQEAAEAARAAYSLEWAWGDAPTWRPFFDAMEVALDAVEVAQQQQHEDA